MTGEERLRAAFEQAERALPPLRPDRDATLARGHRLLRRRALATLASGAVLFSALAGGAIAARGAIQDEEAPESTGDDRNGDGDTTDRMGERRADLVAMLTPTAGEAVLTVENPGDADARSFVVKAVDPGTQQPVAPEQHFSGLAAGASEVRELPCQGSVEAHVDATQEVAESDEQNNVARADCAPAPDTTETAPQTTETSPTPSLE